MKAKLARVVLGQKGDNQMEVKHQLLILFRKYFVNKPCNKSNVLSIQSFSTRIKIQIKTAFRTQA